MTKENNYIYAWIGEDVMNEETGIITMLTSDNHPMPLVAKEERIARLFTPFVINSFGHKNIRLVKFISSEVLIKL